MNKYLIKLADHLDKKGLYKEADYVDWIIKNASDNISNNEQIINILKEKNLKAAEYLTKILKESNKLFLYRKGGFLKKEIYAKFAVNYRHFRNTDSAPGYRDLFFEVKVDFVNKSGEKHKAKDLKGITIEDNVKAFNDMYRRIQAPNSAVSGGKIDSSSYFGKGAHLFYIRY